MMLASIRGDSFRAQWLRGSALGLAIYGVGLLLAFASSVLTARLLGPEGVGRFGYAMAIVALVSVVATLGLPIVTARLLPTYQHRGEWAAAQGLIRWANWVVGLLGVGLGVVVLVGVFLLIDEGRRLLYLWASPLIVVLALSNLRQRELQGFQHPIAAQVPEQLVKHSVFLLFAMALLATGSSQPVGAEGLMMVWLAASVTSLLVGMLLLNRHTPPELRGARALYAPRQWLTIAVPFAAADMIGAILGSSDTIVLGWFRPVEEVGHYQVALRLSGLMLLLMTASNWVVAPWFAKLHASGDTKRLQVVVTKTTRAIFGATLGLYVALILWGEPLLGAIYGVEFAASYPALLILGAGHLTNVASGPVVNLLAMTGGERQLAQTVFAAAVLNVVLCVALVPAFGDIGAAAGVAITSCMYNLALAGVVKRRIGVSTTVLGSVKPAL